MGLESQQRLKTTTTILMPKNIQPETKKMKTGIKILCLHQCTLLLAVGTQLLVFGREYICLAIWMYNLVNHWSRCTPMNLPCCLFACLVATIFWLRLNDIGFVELLENREELDETDTGKMRN